jgi:hypothetical protein
VSEWSKFNAIGLREAARFLTFSTLAGAQLSRCLGLTCDPSPAIETGDGVVSAPPAPIPISLRFCRIVHGRQVIS